MTTFNIGGEGGNAFSFETIGARVRGKIRNLEEVLQTDMRTGEPQFWPNQQPKKMYRVTLQTQLRDPDDPHDDGTRTVHLRGSRKPESRSSLSATLEAVRRATGGTELAYDGELDLAYVADGPRTQPGFNPPKLYEASYTPPGMTLGAGEPGSGPAAPIAQHAQPTLQKAMHSQPAQPPAWAQPAPTAPPPQQVPPTQPAPGQPAVHAPQTGAASGWTPEQEAALKAAGFTPEQIAAMAAEPQHPPAA